VYGKRSFHQYEYDRVLVVDDLLQPHLDHRRMVRDPIQRHPGGYEQGDLLLRLVRKRRTELMLG
jgi:hypothetical protein